MFTAINLKQTKPYQSPNDPDKENPTTFHLGVLDTFVKGYIEDNTSVIGNRFVSGEEEKVSVNINLAARNMLVVRFGLKGIDNLKDPETGTPVAFETEKMSIVGEEYQILAKKVLKIIPYQLIGELAGEILKLNSLSEEEAKN
jgi:hypothetical protein